MKGGKDNPCAEDLLSKAMRNHLNVGCLCVLENKDDPKGMIVKGRMSPAVDVNQICWNIKPRKSVAKHKLVFAEGIPVPLANAITGFLFTNGSKFKGPVNVGIQVTNIQPFSERQ